MVSVIILNSESNQALEQRVIELEEALLMLATRAGFLTNWLENSCKEGSPESVRSGRQFVNIALEVLKNGTGQSNTFRERVERAVSESRKALERVSKPRLV